MKEDVENRKTISIICIYHYMLQHFYNGQYFPPLYPSILFFKIKVL